jgi:two-component system LytT family response regulator
MKTCIIIDDEPKARLLLRNMLQEIPIPTKVLADCDDLQGGVALIKQLKPDIVLLDIEMPGHSGLEILNFFEDDELSFDLIFTTGYSEYAIDAFRLSATDYLLKPINQQQLEDTLQHILKKDRQKKISEYRLLQQNLMGENAFNEKCIIINLLNTTRFIKVKDLICVTAEGSYSKLFLKNGEVLVASKNLKHFAEVLQDVPFFFRCHKSYLINLREVREYQRTDQQVFLGPHCSAYVSAEKSELFLKKMDELY